MSYAPGEPVPHDGEVACLLHPDVVANVKAGEEFPIPGHFGESEACAWEYTS